MATPRVMSGARAKVSIYDPATGAPTTIGIFTNVSYGWALSTGVAHILGRFSPAAIEYVSSEVVDITASGWRSIGHGPFVDGHLPRLQDLLTTDYLTFTIFDRQLEDSGAADARVATIINVRPTSFGTSLTAKSLEEITMHFQGTLFSGDESVDNFEPRNSTNLP